MREQLLDYLLGTLSTAEREQLEAKLLDDADLRAELERLRACMAPIEDEGTFEPPGDLSKRTVDYVMDRRGPSAGQFAAQSTWRIQDLAVALCIFVTAAMLFFPAVFNSRSCAQIRACQQNLAKLGKALFQFSETHDGDFPLVPTEGNLSAAGVYAPRLMSAGLIDNRTVLCPGSELARNADFRVPSIAEIEQAHGEALRRLQATMGGSYGYSLGYVMNGRYYGLRNQSRRSFALIADTPLDPTTGANHHGDCGQNVLFEDGRVELLKACRLALESDHIFQNNLGHVGAGIGPHDSVISPSATRPLVMRPVQHPSQDDE